VEACKAGRKKFLFLFADDVITQVRTPEIFHKNNKTLLKLMNCLSKAAGFKINTKN
jgi:hypothetical protein